MGRRRGSDRWRGPASSSSACSSCSRVAAAVLLLCVCCGLLVVTTVATTSTDAAARLLAPGRANGLPTVSGAGATVAADDASFFLNSKRRIPKGPDPIHNRRVEKTVAPRRRD